MRKKWKRGNRGMYRRREEERARGGRAACRWAPHWLDSSIMKKDEWWKSGIWADHSFLSPSIVVSRTFLPFPPRSPTPFPPPPFSSRFLSVSIAPMCLPPKWKRSALIFRPLLDDYHFIFQLPIIPLLPPFIAPFSFSLRFPSILSPSFSHSACTAVIHATEQ